MTRFLQLVDARTASKREVTISEADVYTDSGLIFRENLIADVGRQIRPECALDLGTGEGDHAFVLSQFSKMVIAVDHNVWAVDRLNRRIRREHKTNIVPICMDVSARTSNGPKSSETDGNDYLLRYFRAQLASGLALIHYLCIESGLSMHHVAFLFHSLADHVIVEFVPADDIKVRQLTKKGRQVPSDYSLERCVDAFRQYYESHSVFQVPDSDRSILCFVRNGSQR